MKKSMKYPFIIALVLICMTLLVSGNAGAVIVAPQPSTMVVSSAPVASPLFGSGISSGVAVRPFGFGFPFFRPFFGFPFFNPFFDIDPFFFD
ncbi:MAG TPA: hypothetical protein VF888_05330 [Nitrospirota bacterium]